MTSKTSICIPTYKREHLLVLLLQDILEQSLKPDHIIIVDGDPPSDKVRDVLQSLSSDVPITYVPSNHGNLPYQRYLGWRVAADLQADVLIYFDDDERLPADDILSWLIAPFESHSDVVGVGCVIRLGETTNESDASFVRRSSRSSVLAQMLGSAKNVPPGHLTPTGHRKLPKDTQSEYVETQWLRGGVMAYRMSAISKDTFSRDLFATYEKRIGRAEDTFLSRRVGVFGRTLFTFRAVVEHPNLDIPKAYAYEIDKYAYAATYSRRFLNDHYRVYDPPTLADRWALVKSYAGNALLAWMKVLRQPNKPNFAYARGTTLGAFHGLTRPPTAKRLTPHIDWWGDAEKALANAEVIHYAEG